MQQLQLKFEVKAPELDETSAKAQFAELSASTLAIRLSELKAASIAHKHPEAFVIGCDQTAELEGLTLGKPQNERAAVEQLNHCSGKTVTFHSALALMNTSKNITCSEVIETKVHFRPLGPSEIIHYVEREKPLNCAGSFMCEGLGISLFDALTSDDPSALIGLPLIALNKMLLAQGINTLLTK